MTDSAQADGETLGQSESYRLCECSEWWYERDDEVHAQIETRCNRSIPGDRTFAQGHDAKLKSLLIEAGVLGVQVGRRIEGVTTWMSVDSAADRFGFSHQVYDGIQAGKAVVSKKRDRESARALRKTEKDIKKRKQEAAKGQPQIKVGRWKYNVIEERENVYYYIDGKGNEQQIAKDKAQLV